MGDDGCDEFLCCLCAPLAAIFCCKLCKDKMIPNNVSQAPNSDFYGDVDRRVPAGGMYGPQGYGPRIQNQTGFYPGSPRPNYPQGQPVQRDYYYPPAQNQVRYDQSEAYVKRQSRIY